MMNNLIEKKKKQRTALDLLMKKKDHYVATLFLDEDQITRAELRGELLSIENNFKKKKKKIKSVA
jgi:hypothetical protein